MLRILIFRPDNIGDVLLFSGAFKHIRKLYPHARITVAVQDHIKNMVELCPYIDKCVPIEELSWWLRAEKSMMPGIARLEGMIRRLNKTWNRLIQPYDLIIYPVKSPQMRHLRILYDLGSKKITGIAGCSINEPEAGYLAKLQPKRLFSDYLDVSNAEPWRHELLTTLDFLSFFGCQVNKIEELMPEFWLSNLDNNYLIPKSERRRKLIGLFPGGSSRGKCWKPDNYTEMVKLIGGIADYVIFGGHKEKDLASQITSFLKKSGASVNVFNLTGKTTLRELIQCISTCDLFIGMDTCGLHMAITADIPSVGIIGGWHYGRFVPWGSPDKHIFLTKTMDCFHCKWDCKKENFECIQAVTPKDVAIAARKLLACK